MANSLRIEGIDAGYGAVRVLNAVSLSVGSGETVALLGTNGNGKSTLMKCVMGMVRPSAGSIVAEIDGARHELVGRATEDIVDLGVAFVPEGRRLFPKLSVTENLLLGAFRRAARASIERNMAFCFETFPRLKERRRQLAGSMSGGEQQMLALARALMTAPRILLIDEPSVGLAPLLVRRTIDKIKELKDGFQLTVLMAEQNFHPGHPHRGPGLCDRARQDRVRGPLGRRAQQQRADPAVLSGAVARQAPQSGGGQGGGEADGLAGGAGHHQAGVRAACGGAGGLAGAALAASGAAGASGSACARRGGCSTSGSGSRVSLRHSGRSSRPACGEAASSARISGSSTSARRWGTKHPRPYCRNTGPRGMPSGRRICAGRSAAGGEVARRRGAAGSLPAA